ncbi:PKHD-type hydroxylase YbiX [Thalassobaculum fulvum]|jgi:PKHD-type hydroxylase|uniref:PKHD-type hydroxylase YbiX n=1 Tax=Thalassobaculum fulvum TaxID=1633335 RepID=A0A918XS45_9PROT|nr:Fe2+-dependent dioxygenase [Thalassobaculum fulvum]GHD51519.1 PKHD-type hydroxylase YbiX [Thalassobaculum fulvum]
MVAVIEGLLSKDQVQTIAKRLFGAQFVDGSMSGGPLGESIKKNTQVSPQSPEYRELSQLVLGVLRQNDQVAITALPRRILSPIFASYVEGNRYGEHVDAALMGPYPGMRTDLSITIFLNDPGAYEGGELVMQTPFGEQVYKRPSGDAVLYPTHYVHRVNPVTRGRRLAIVTWMESMVRDPAKREIIGDLAEVMDRLVRDNADGESIRRVEKARLNLLRMWAET